MMKKIKFYLLFIILIIYISNVKAQKNILDYIKLLPKVNQPYQELTYKLNYDSIIDIRNGYVRYRCNCDHYGATYDYALFKKNNGDIIIVSFIDKYFADCTDKKINAFEYIDNKLIDKTEQIFPDLPPSLFFNNDSIVNFIKTEKEKTTLIDNDNYNKYYLEGICIYDLYFYIPRFGTEVIVGLRPILYSNSPKLYYFFPDCLFSQEKKIELIKQSNQIILKWNRATGKFLVKGT